MEGSAFVDTNILLRHILADDSSQSPAASKLFSSVESGDAVVRIADTVVFEAVYVLQSRYDVPRSEISESVLSILELPGVMLDGKSAYREVCSLWTSQPILSFADCFHAVLAKRFSGGVIISYDKGFDRLPGVVRREPPAVAD